MGLFDKILNKGVEILGDMISEQASEQVKEYGPQTREDNRSL